MMASDAQTGNTNVSHNYIYSAFYSTTTTTHRHKGLANKLNHFALWPLEKYLHPPVLHPWMGLGFMFRK
jgi:hypothetical protein